LGMDVEDVLKHRMGFAAHAQDQKSLGLKTQPKTPASAGGVRWG
jgi:hypothetical protein